MQKEVLERLPKYGMRKLSVGLVSCFLRYGIVSSPTIVSAQVIEGTSADSELQYIQEDIQRHKTNTVVSNSTDNEIMNKDNVNNTKVIENSQSIKPESTPELGNRNMITNSNYSMNETSSLGNRNLEMSDNNISNPVKASQDNNKVEKIVTNETKTPDNSNQVGDIDNTVLDSEGNFIGKEDGSVSLDGNKDIASKEDFDKAITVDEFNEKVRAEKEAEYKAEKENNYNKRREIDNLIEDRAKMRSDDMINQFQEDFKNDLKELDKYGHYGMQLSVPKSDIYKIDKDSVLRYYNEYEWRVDGKGNSYKIYPHRENYNIINIKSKNIIFDKGVDNAIYFHLIYNKPSRGGSQELDDYIKNSNLENRLNDFFYNYRDQYYTLDKKYYDDLEKEKTEIDEKNRKLEDKIRFNKNKKYAEIKEEDLRPKNIEIIKDPTIWEGSLGGKDIQKMVI